MSRPVNRFPAVAAATAIALAACGSAAKTSRPASATRQTTERTATTRVVVACSIAVSFNSLAEMRRAARAVVELRPTGATRPLPGAGGPETLSEVRVLAHIAGRPVPRRFWLRQTGGPGVETDGCGTLVAAGNTYIGYVVPFTYNRHGPPVPGQYTLVGPMGLYEQMGSSFVRLYSEAPQLPPRITLAQAAR